MEFPELKIGNLRPKYPIIQGGMAIKVSMSKLAAAVANKESKTTNRGNNWREYNVCSNRFYERYKSFN